MKQQYPSLERLAQTTVQAFKQQNEVQKVFFFGSYAQDRHDPYSDIDLQVVSEHYSQSQQNLIETLRLIDEPLVIFPLKEQEGLSAYTVMFWHYSLYHKLDLGLQDSSLQTSYHEEKIAYLRPPARRTQMEETCQEIVPAPSLGQELFVLPPLERFLYDIFIGATRYAKCRKRQQAISAFRFYHAVLNAVLLDARNRLDGGLGGNEPYKVLGRKDYPKLDAATCQAELSSCLYAADPQAMDGLVVRMLRQLLQQAQEQLTADHVRALQHFIRFIADELAIPVE